MNIKPLLPLAALFVSISAAASDRYFVDPRQPTEVQAAHDAFLNGDFKELGVDIKRALLAYPGDAAIRADVLELFDKAYALKGDSAIPADWSVPSGLTYLTVQSKKRYNVDRGEILHRLSLYGELKKGQEVEQAQILRYPGEVIVDKQGGIGDFEPGFEDGVANFFFAQDYRTTPNGEGLYLLTLKLKGQEAVQGWFVLSHMNASESPAVAVPTVNQSFAGGTPTFQWSDFVSPEYRSFERRKVYASVVERRSDAKDNDWALNVTPPASSATVGAGVAGETGVKALAKGDFAFQLSYRERIRFGDLCIARESSTSVPFSVR